MNDEQAWVVDLHGATCSYAAVAALSGIVARHGDLLWQEIPAARSCVDALFGYALAAALVTTHLGLRMRPGKMQTSALVLLVLLASVCCAQLMARLWSAPSYVVYEGDPVVTVAACGAVLWAWHASCWSRTFEL